jgi:hypothetical protein
MVLIRKSWRKISTTGMKCNSRLPALRQKHAFLRDTRATSATEFALIAPVLLLMLVGAAEYTRMTMVQARMDALSFNMGQVLVAIDSMPPGQRRQLLWTDMMPVALDGLDSRRFKGTVAQVRASPTAAVDWQTSPSGRATGEDMLALAGSVSSGQSVIVSSVSYSLQPLAFRGFLGAITLSARTVHRQFAPL